MDIIGPTNRGNIGYPLVMMLIESKVDRNIGESASAQGVKLVYTLNAYQARKNAKSLIPGTICLNAQSAPRRLTPVQLRYLLFYLFFSITFTKYFLKM